MFIGTSELILVNEFWSDRVVMRLQCVRLKSPRDVHVIIHFIVKPCAAVMQCNKELLMYVFFNKIFILSYFVPREP